MTTNREHLLILEGLFVLPPLVRLLYLVPLGGRKVRSQSQIYKRSLLKEDSCENHLKVFIVILLTLKALSF